MKFEKLNVKCEKTFWKAVQKELIVNHILFVFHPSTKNVGHNQLLAWSHLLIPL